MSFLCLGRVDQDKDPIDDGEKAMLKHALKELQLENKALKSYICRSCIVLVKYYVKTFDSHIRTYTCSCALLRSNLLVNHRARREALLSLNLPSMHTRLPFSLYEVQRLGS